MNSDIDLKAILWIMRRQMWLVLSTFVAILAVAMVALFSVTPRFTAEALVIVDTKDKNLLGAEAAMQSASTDNARVESEAAILRSTRVLMSLIKDENILMDPEFGVRVSVTDRLLSLLRLPTTPLLDGDQLLAATIKRLDAAVTVRHEDQTYLISVGLRSVDPAKAARYVNALTDAYIREQITSKISGKLTARDALQKRVTAARAAIAENETAFDTYLDHSLSRIPFGTGDAARIGALRAEVRQMAQAHATESERLDRARHAIATQDLQQLVSALGAEALRIMLEKRDALRQSMLAVPQASVAAVRLREEMRSLEEEIRKGGDAGVAELQTSIGNYQDRNRALRQDIRAAVLDSDLPPDVLTEIYGLQKSAEVARTQYQTLLSRLQDLDAQIDLQLPDSRVVSPALLPTDPSYPNRPLVLGISLCLALGCGVALAILREYFIGGFVSEAQLEAVLHTELASVTPSLGGLSDVSPDGGDSLADLMVTAPLSQFSESIRRLRLALDHAHRRRWSAATEAEPKGRIVMTSSALPGEGKSTMALALARAYALTGHRTLLIDCDLRKPTIHRQMNLDASDDFLAFLQGAHGLSGLPPLTTDDPLTTLKVVRGGGASQTATDELVMGDQMAGLLRIARRHFDYIVLDSPPLEPVVDGLYLAWHADLIVFIVKWAVTPQTSAKRALSALKQNMNAGTHVAAVLTQRERSRFNGYDRAYAGISRI